MANLDRAILELRCGRPLLLEDGGAAFVVVALDTLDDARFADVCDVVRTRPRLVLNAERARILGLPLNGADAISVSFSAPGTVEQWLSVAANPVNGTKPEFMNSMSGIRTARATEQAALALAKSSRLLPAIVSFRMPQRKPVWLTRHLENGEMLAFTAADLMRDADPDGVVLTRVSEADIALGEAQQSRFVLYRANDGLSEHIAILIGEWRRQDVVPVRIHSACLTGDLFGSLRCDCGEQLRTGVGRIAESGGGILLYLAQEGRGIGLANKLRAYTLQDGGLDTVDADQVLGFGADERSYTAAAHILRDLGVEEIELLTNNPDKISALEANGITVRRRASLQGEVNRHNQRYLVAKATRAGHLLDLEETPGVVTFRSAKSA